VYHTHFIAPRGTVVLLKNETDIAGKLIVGFLALNPVLALDFAQQITIVIIVH
jgi:hypothetical protein